jgi:glycosyltransferase involved in cell wall biosynthesis
MPPNDAPLVSVVLVIRDVERYLPQAIESVLGQSFRNFEFLIVDFGSRDSSKQIAAGYADRDSRVRLVEIPACSYIQAKVSACALPAGHYIAIQDADDISYPDRLKLEVDFLESHPRVGLLGGAVQWIDGNGNWLPSADDPPTEDPQLRQALKERNPFWHPTVLMRRDAYAQAGGYRAAFTQSDDYDLWLRISETYQCANLTEKLLYYRIHPNQLSLRKKKDQVLCALAAQASAAFRAEGKPDPLNTAREITPALLASLGVSEASQQHALARAYSYWIEQLYSANEYAAVVGACAEMLTECKQQDVGSRVVSEAHLRSAKASWKLDHYVQSSLSAARAILARPAILGRSLRPLLRPLRGAQ